MATKQSTSRKATSATKKTKKWSNKVTQHSDALDLEKGVFTMSSGKKIAESLKRSALKSNRKKGTTYQSAMSMLNFYINRGGKNLSPTRKKILERAKTSLKKIFDRDDQ